MASVLNEISRRGELYKLVEIIDEYDRPITQREKMRPIFYIEIGITSNEKYMSMQAKIDVVRRVKVRYDKSIDETHSSLRIDDTDYKIVRIYVDGRKREMELTLSYLK